jgi:hypothetical protein
MKLHALLFSLLADGAHKGLVVDLYEGSHAAWIYFMLFRVLVQTNELSLLRPVVTLVNEHFGCRFATAFPDRLSNLLFDCRCVRISPVVDAAEVNTFDFGP